MVLKYIDKIGEITSIKVANERLVFIAEKLEQKEKECDRLEERLAVLEAENDLLARENRNLKKSIKEAKETEDQIVDLSDSQFLMVQILSEESTGVLSMHEFMVLLRMKPSLLELNVRRLEKVGLIEKSDLVTSEEARYRLTEKGIIYMDEQFPPSNRVHYRHF